MKTCIILDDYQGAALGQADWARLAGQVAVSSVRDHLPDEDALAARLAEAEIVVIMRERTRFPASLLHRLPKLRLLVTSGMANAAVDLEAARANGIVVCGTGGSLRPPVELTWGLILALARRIVPENASLRAGGRWQDSVGMDLDGRQLGIVGLGRIGSDVARIGRAFGMRIVAWSPNLTEERAAAAGAVLAASKEALLEGSDVVTIHLVLSASTRGLIGAEALRRMGRHAFLVNTARAPIVEEAALVQALEEGWIAGAGLDVFEIEPLPADHPFRRLPNVLATPHLGYVSERNYRTFFTEGLEDIEAWLAGAPVRTLG